MIGGFFNRYCDSWDDDALCWFEALLDADDVDIMAWALGTQAPPATIAGPQLALMQRLDYVEIAR